MGAKPDTPGREHNLETQGDGYRCERCGGTFYREDAARIIACVPLEEQHSSVSFTKAGQL